MLSALKKVLSTVVVEGKLENAEAEQALLENEDGSMSVVTAEMFSEINGKLEAALQLASSKDSEILSLTEKLAALNSEAAKLQAEVDLARTAAQAKEYQDRKQSLSEVLGKDNAKLESVFESIKDLPAESFSAVVDGMKTSFKQEEESVGFKELGVSGKAELSTEVESKEMRILKKKYSN